MKLIRMINWVKHVIVNSGMLFLSNVFLHGFLVVFHGFPVVFYGFHWFGVLQEAFICTCGGTILELSHISPHN